MAGLEPYISALAVLENVPPPLVVQVIILHYYAVSITDV